VPLAESIVDFVKQRGKRAVALITEIDAQGIEAIAEQPRHAEQPNRPAVRRDAGRLQVAFDRSRNGGPPSAIREILRRRAVHHPLRLSS
jgi:hypothetical protein